MAWSFPAVATVAAILCGLGAASAPVPAGAASRRPLPFRIGIGAVLAVAVGLALTRFYASTLVGSGQQALAFGASSLAIQDLTWALRLNPMSFPARRWLAHARLREGDPAGALAVAERAARLAPGDPNGWFLAGEIAAASGQWARADRWFQGAVVRAPFSQLRFHAGAVEAAARAGDVSGARHRYAEALAAFSPDRVVHPEARCLAPGDRYLLARMGRIAAGLHRTAGDHAQEREAERLARRLAEPDTRGICAVAGREGEASPKSAMVGFWDGLGRGGWREAERFVAPPEHHPIPEPVRQRWAKNTQGTQPTVSWVAGLSGNESQATLTVELLAYGASGQPIRRCARGSLRAVNRGWFLEELPQVFPDPCTP
jgi:tetratricopeptide (TPR) repeat protein